MGKKMGEKGRGKKWRREENGKIIAFSLFFSLSTHSGQPNMLPCWHASMRNSICIHFKFKFIRDLVNLLVLFPMGCVDLIKNEYGNYTIVPCKSCVNRYDDTPPSDVNTM
jgi:hypothetical protein